MAVLAKDGGVGPDDWTVPIRPLDALDVAPAEGELAVDLPNDRDPAELSPWLDRLGLVRVVFPAMGDGRGFSIARRLRAMGYAGRLRAAGPLVADQARAAWSVGFDEAELPEDVAKRQGTEAWAPRRQGSYQDRLFG